MLTALTGIDRHESIFAALEEAPAKGIGLTWASQPKGDRQGSTTARPTLAPV
jgi:hypothetical protein